MTTIDWESAEQDGLPHLDQLYFEIATGVLVKGWSAGRLADFLTAWPSDARANLNADENAALLTVLLHERLLLWRDHALADGHALVQGSLLALRRMAQSEGIAA